MKSLLNSEKADLDNDGKLSSYERKRGEAVEKSMREKKSIGGAIARAISKATPKTKPKNFFDAMDDKALSRLKASGEDADISIRGFYKSKNARDDLLDGSRDENEVRALLQASGFSSKEIDAVINNVRKSLDSIDDDSTDMAMRGMNKGGYVDNEMTRLGFKEGGDKELRMMLQQRKAMEMIQKSTLDDVAYDQMIMDMEENKDISGFRKPHSSFDMFIQNQDSKDMFLNLLKNRNEILEREQKAEGGEMLNDEDMEENFVEYIIKESLSEEEQNELKEQLEANPKLSELFDEVVIKASEFTGAGSVDGPGTGTSDDIPARLSDGEFVFTAKAVEQIGADNLMQMMKDAEAAYDAGGEREAMQEGGMSSDTEKVEVEYTINRPADTVVSGATPLLAQQEQEDMMDEEIKKGMLGITPYVRS